jgi:hypothetical protein
MRRLPLLRRRPHTVGGALLPRLRSASLDERLEWDHLELRGKLGLRLLPISLGEEHGFPLEALVAEVLRT